MKTKKNHNYTFVVALALLLLTGCYDSDNVGENFYTFTGETVGSYFDAHPETYSEFNQAIKIAGLTELLKTYNHYTCFAPTNEAMQEWYDSQEVASIEAISNSDVQYMVYSHLIPGKVYKTTDFVEGALSATNMNSRYLVIGYQAQTATVDILINTNSVILDKDIEAENGIIHSINRVLTPSTAAIPTLMANDPRINLFVEALEATGLADSLQMLRDEHYLPEKSPISWDGATICRSPKERKFGYSVFVETNTVLAANGITDLESLKTFAARIYDATYPADADISDQTDRRNSLNRFIAYHLIDKTVHYNNFFYKANMAQSVTLYEFMETFCPNTIFKVSNEAGGVVLNSDLVRNVKGVTVLPAESGYEQDTDNGVYHLIDNILVYDQKVVTMLLNSRIRIDAASLHPELMSNGIRYEKGDDPAGITGHSNYYRFANGYLKNVEFVSSNTNLFYLQGAKSGAHYWTNYQADEMMATGQFDFVMRLPPVPAGTYEIRFGYSANNDRGILQFYIDGEPKGIPLNMKRGATDAAIGWVADGSTLDGGTENDKMMRNRGYMKGGTSYMAGSVSARADAGAIRRIVSTETWDYDGPHYLRFKSVSDDGGDQFMIDYFEYVPKNVYENPNGEDRL
ncbi:MAG: hypothetical protein EZS26_000936 [Candidatus Ordinivivax streblomastigis]|uniref:FAS1 domain-containing protein n=1 Tax=Candidatus Ordinivivax streblomastigis TaxID=2540710 RepID=A0A5M8P364_9BACT|nr:MAG: hypothetical protein EZS26_000936 [Candidatus Ordinivivax streblomastigis]